VDMHLVLFNGFPPEHTHSAWITILSYRNTSTTFKSTHTHAHQTHKFTTLTKNPPAPAPSISADQ
jgi:hypothetical protein